MKHFAIYQHTPDHMREIYSGLLLNCVFKNNYFHKIKTKKLCMKNKVVHNCAVNSQEPEKMSRIIFK